MGQKVPFRRPVRLRNDRVRGFSDGFGKFRELRLRQGALPEVRMRNALISDIHANLPPLEAVLEDIDERYSRSPRRS
jgi:hypothetical protein